MSRVAGTAAWGWGRYWVCICAALFAWGCWGKGIATGPPKSKDDARYLWVSTRCVDGPLDLASVGFAEELFVSRRGASTWLTRNTEVVRDACRQWALWESAANHDGTQVGSDAGGAWVDDRETGYVAVSELALPRARPCPVSEARGTRARLLFDGDFAVLDIRRSSYCRGYDAQFTYRRVAPRAATQREVILRFFTLQNIRNAAQSTAMFAETSELIEPFSRTHDGRPMRHVGLDSIRTYFEHVFDAASWSAYRVLELRRQGGNEWVAEWSYMDSELKVPFRGRSLFTVGGEKLFAVQLQALSTPLPR